MPVLLLSCLLCTRFESLVLAEVSGMSRFANYCRTDPTLAMPYEVGGEACIGVSSNLPQADDAPSGWRLALASERLVTRLVSRKAFFAGLTLSGSSAC